ncbi:MAG: DNA alkylation repair protein [Planctomycetota bacterium]|jgi:3-methyladenine DNA glycosylase AlkD
MSIRTQQIVKKMRELGDSEIAAHSQRFFKTGPGEYGEGDIFLGIRVPVVRKCVKEFRTVSLEDTLELLQNQFHEVRLFALLIMVAKYGAAGTNAEQTAVYRAYLGHTKFINNWDLVDCSAVRIVGAHLFARSRKPVYRLARSKSLWERRIAVISTFFFLNNEDYSDSLAIAELLLKDKEDLIHKAVGWMLREVGNRDRETEEKFLTKHYRQMPRTMLRYAIEKLPESDRQAYLRGTK